MANKKKNVNNVVEKEVKVSETISTSPQTISISDLAFIPQISVESAVVNKMYSEEDVKELLNEMAVATLLSNQDFKADVFVGLGIKELKEEVKSYIENRVKEIEELQKEKDALKKQVEELKKQSNNIKKEFVIVLKKSNVNADYRVNGFNITLQNFNQVKEKGVNLQNISNYGLLMDVEEYKKKIKDDKNVVNYADFMFASF